MADGSTKRIVDVQVGDQVRCRDPQTGKDEAKTVTATIERHAPSVVSVALYDAKTGASETLTCTPEHPFFVPNQGWVEAGSLGIGTSIVTRAGPQMAVASVTWQKNKAQELASAGGLGGYTVYNLTVADDHTFFVGTTGGGTWVHNTGCGKIIDKGGQDKHIPGTNNNNYLLSKGKYPSELTHPDPQSLLDNFGRASGAAGDKDLVDFGQTIGNDRNELTGARTPTTWGKIHYNGSGGAHIVPTYPR